MNLLQEEMNKLVEYRRGLNARARAGSLRYQVDGLILGVLNLWAEVDRLKAELKKMKKWRKAKAAK